ncbi:MAG: phosphoglycerate dehydrogenase [Oscillospiraceae bacterium]
MNNIQILNKISPIGLEQFDRTKYAYAEEIENPDGLLLRSAKIHDMEFGESVKAIARAGAGVNNIPIDRCSKEGIVVFNTPGANANAVKEMVFAGLLMSARKVAPSLDWVQTLKGEGENVPALIEKGKSKFAGPELKGKTLGVIGLGAIGIQVANLAIAFGMDVYGYDPYISVDSAWELSRSVNHAKTLEEIYAKSDYVTIHVPLNPETKSLINAETIKRMKHGVRIVNFARGELVETADIIEALNEGLVSCYLTDFGNDELLGQKGVVVFPHLGASTPESEDNCAKMAVMELSNFLENGNIVNSVNMPNVVMERSGDVRLTVIHENKPNMLSQILAVLSEKGLNVENLTNKSKKEYAYTMVDVLGNVDADIENAVSAIDGVIKVRIIK